MMIITNTHNKQLVSFQYSDYEYDCAQYTVSVISVLS